MCTLKNVVWGAALVLATFMMAVVSPTARADEGFKELTRTGSYSEIRDDLKNAIINRGYVVDYVGYFNKMLERTSEAVGSVTEAGAKSPYKDAEFMQFCAAKFTHEAISANPQNIVNCPYVVYVYELTAKPGLIHVGYRIPVTGASKISRNAVAKIDALLNEIITEVTK
ncbi:MAG: hypothetical protein AB7U75_05780 [Hyphomicrobiaceae bacterium]